MAVSNPFSEIAKLAGKRPALLVAGLGGVGVLAFFATRNSGSAPLAPDAPPADDAAAQTDLLGTGASPADASPYAGPPGFGYDPFGGSGTDPYGGQSSDPGTTADGCSWPPPSIPAGYEGRGSWSCDSASASWVWHWIDPVTPPTPGGGQCPLPKPTLPPRLAGKYKYVCKGGRWVLKAIAAPDPKPGPTPQPKPNVSKGTHATYAGHRNAKRHLILSDRRVVTLAHAQHWHLAAAETGDRTPGQHGGEIKVHRIIAAPGHSGLVGRFLQNG